MAYQMMKVFDCQEMPDEVRNYFFKHSEKGNDCLVTYWIEPDEVNEETETEVWNPVALWLKRNGAELHEGVIVKHSW